MEIRLPDGSRSIQSPWIWRGFLLLSLVALGLVIAFAASGHSLFAAEWGVITAGWFATSMWLWRQHVQYEDALYAARRTGGGAKKAPALPR